MSFSGDVKRQLCQVPPTKDCCALAELYGLLLFSTVFDPREIRIVTGVAKLPARLEILGKRVLPGDSFPFVQTLSGRGKTTLTITDTDVLRKLFTLFGYDADKQVVLHLHGWHMEEDCCRAAFLRGVFLAGGYLADPEKDYYLEITTSHRALGRELAALMGEMELFAKLTLRRQTSVIYIKDSEQIEAFLTLTGAHRAALSIMEAKVIKDVRNQINRKVNCETSNLLRSVETGQTQAEAIRNFLETHPMDVLPKPLQQAASLRLAYPDEPLSVLASLSDPPLTKSGLNHRLGRLMKIIAEQTALRGEGE